MASKIRVACVGDSITEGFRGVWCHPSPNAYPATLQTLLGPSHEVANLGSSGATMSKGGTDNGNQADYWSRPKFQELVKGGWDIIVVCMGTNDAKTVATGAEADNWPGGLHTKPVDAESAEDVFRTQLCQSTPTFVSSYLDFLAFARTLGNARNGGEPAIFVCIPPPALSDGAFGVSQSVVNSVLPKLMPLIAKGAGYSQTRVVDLFGALGGREMAMVPSGGYALGGDAVGHGDGNDDVGPRRFFCDAEWNDNLHPCDAGFAAIAEAVGAAIKRDSTATAARACCNRGWAHRRTKSGQVGESEDAGESDRINKRESWYLIQLPSALFKQGDAGWLVFFF